MQVLKYDFLGVLLPGSNREKNRTYEFPNDELGALSKHSAMDLTSGVEILFH
jgi:hypothetical protein